MTTPTAHNIAELKQAGKNVNSMADGAHYAGEIESSKVPEDAWGLLGQVYFHGKYVELLDQFTGHVNDMVHGLQSAGQKINDHASSTEHNEQEVADQFARIHQKLSSAGAPPMVGKGDAAQSASWAPSGGDLAKSAPMGGNVVKGVGDVQKFLKDINGDTAGTDITNDVTNVLSDGVGIGAEVASFASDPLGWLISKGVSFLIDLIAPLKKCLEMVTGNGAAVNAAAANFNKVGKDIEHLVQEFSDTVDKGFAQSKGDATEAARERLSHFRDGIAGTAGRSGDIAQLLQFTGMLMQAAEDFIKGIITDVIEFILMSQAAGAVLSFFTFGATEVAATAADAAKVAEEAVKCEKEVQKVSDLLTKTANVWEKIGTKFMKGGAKDAFEKMSIDRGAVFEISTKQGLKTTLRDSVKNQGLKTLGYKTGGHKEDIAQSATGISQKATQLGQGAEYGDSGSDESDKQIDDDFNV